jgi:hypothetical protein
MADTTISSLNTVNTLSANNFIPISDGTNTTKLGTDSLFGFRNRIINGDMRIWQRGTSFTGVGAVAYTADRFQLTLNGVNGSVTQSTDVPDTQTLYSLKLVPASNATPTEFAVRQWLELQNITDFAGNTVTASAWVKCTRTSIKVRCAAYNATGGTDQIQTKTVVANTWTKITATFSSFSAVTTWTAAPNAQGGFLDIGFGEDIAITTADSLFITGVQLEVGSTATPFERRPYGLELSLCQRYYNRITLAATDASLTQSFFDAAFWTGPTAFDGYCHAVYRYPVTMRTTAIATDFSDASTFWYHIGGVAQGALTSIGGNVLGPDRFRFSCRMSYNNGNGLAGQILARNGYTAYLGFSAEL